ncbi:MAG: hypothetical protein AB1458_06570 [Bacteroidota bacterium]
MHFSTGQIIFAVAFFIAFVAAMFWAYRKDLPVSRAYYKGVWVVLVALVLLFFLFRIAVKWLH